MKITIQYIKDIIESFTVDGEKATCTDEQAKEVLDRWVDYESDLFYEFVKDEFKEGEIFNSDEDDHEC